MASLEDDIARIAALRGRSADTQALVDEAAHIRRRVPIAEIEALFLPSPDPARDQLAFDILPPALRAVIRESAKPMNALRMLGLSRSGVPTDSIVKAVHHHLATTETPT